MHDQSSPSSPINVDELHPTQLPLDRLERDCDFQFGRRRGPGGQHRSKTESAVELLHRPSGIMGQASERRSQAENRHQALKRLRLNLALGVRCEALGEFAPTTLWKSRVQREQIHVNESHLDFAPLLAETIDVIAWRHGNVRSAAEQLGVSTSQLIKLVKQEPRAFTLLNELRARHHLPALS